MIATAEAIDTLETDLESLAVEIEQIHSTITVRIILEIGERLNAANLELANNKNGRFEKWVKERLSYTPRTAQRYIAAYRRFADSEYRDSLSEYATAEALYALCSKSDDLVASVIDEAEETGERITLAKVKEPAAVQSDEPLALSDAMLRVGRVLRGILKWFPVEHREVLGNRLMSAGDELIAKGDLR